MTRGEWLLSVRLATWTDRISERLLCDDCRSLGFARDDKGRVATFREVGDWMDRI
jgi:hypothetical protein